jgi:hypothetical protein
MILSCHCNPFFAMFAGMQTSFVYFILAEETNRVKIGFSNEPERRLSDLQTGSPCSLRMLAVFRGNSRTEKALHAKFAKQRINGEWFHFHATIREFLTQNKHKAIVFSYHMPIDCKAPSDATKAVPRPGTIMPRPTPVFGQKKARQPGGLYAFIVYHWGILKYDFLATFVGSLPKIPFRPRTQFLYVNEG